MKWGKKNTEQTKRKGSASYVGKQTKYENIESKDVRSSKRREEIRKLKRKRERCDDEGREKKKEKVARKWRKRKKNE